MTFFIVEENETGPYSHIKDHLTYRAKARQVRNPRLISWNEVYPSYRAFKDAIDHEERFNDLSTMIDTLRSEPAARGFFIPRFLYEFSARSGLEVRRFVWTTASSAPADSDPTAIVEGVPVRSSRGGRGDLGRATLSRPVKTATEVSA